MTLPRSQGIAAFIRLLGCNTEWQRAVEAGTVSPEVQQRYAAVQDNPLLAPFLRWRGFEERLLADPGFLVKVGIEVGSLFGCSYPMPFPALLHAAAAAGPLAAFASCFVHLSLLDHVLYAYRMRSQLGAAITKAHIEVSTQSNRHHRSASGCARRRLRRPPSVDPCSPASWTLCWRIF